MSDQKEQFLTNGFGNILWLDIVNSEHYDGFGNLTDHLQDSEWMATLLEHYQFANIARKQLPQYLLDLRIWLRHIAQTLVQSAPLTSRDMDTLRGYLAEPVLRTLHYSADKEEYAFAF